MNPSNLLNPRMQAVVASVLLAMFAGVMFLPVVFPTFKVDADVKQTLLTLVVLGVSFYLGTSAGSARKDDQNAALTAQLVAAPPTPPTPPAEPEPPK